MSGTMKSGIAFVLAFIHVIALSVIASEIAEEQQWHWAFAVLAWIGGGIIGLFPIVRSLGVIGLCFVALPWEKAIWVGPVLAVVLGVLEKIGNGMLRGRE